MTARDLRRRLSAIEGATWAGLTTWLRIGPDEACSPDGRRCRLADVPEGDDVQTIVLVARGDPSIEVPLFLSERQLSPRARGATK